MNKASGAVALGVVAILIGTMMLKSTYRIRCSCEIEPISPRFAVAPYEGLIEEAYVRPGDIVEAGQLLARMDQRPIDYELASVVASIFKASKQREVDLAKRNVPGSMLADLESQSLNAERNLLEYRKKQVEIRSPISGVVLNGAEDDFASVSVVTGETLFQIGSLDRLRICITIPAEEIAHVEVGQTARIWVEGFESNSFATAIDLVRPRSELKEARNVFIAEVEIDNAEFEFRPGMKGKVRIDCGKNTLAWNLFHKPYNFVMSRMVWW